jgi:hypothetical protein
MKTSMNTPHPPNWAYFYEDTPKLYHDNAGNYLIGLAKIFGAHLCISRNGGGLIDHDFVDNKCIVCGVQRKPREHICDIGCDCGKIVKEKNSD